MKFLLAAILSLQAGAALADDVMWSTSWMPPSGFNWIEDIESVSDGGVAVVIECRDEFENRTYYLVKFSSTGAVQWVLPKDSYTPVDSDALGYIYLAGYNNYDYIRKIDPSGALVWEQQTDFAAGAALADPAGYVYFQERFDGRPAVRKYSAGGVFQWQANTDYESYNSITAERDRLGNVVLLCLRMDVFNPDGDLVLSLSPGLPFLGKDVTAFGPENEVFLGSAPQYDGTGRSPVIKCYGADGGLRWQRTLPDYITSIDCDGRQVFVTTPGQAIWLDLDGADLWQATFPTWGFERALDGLGNLLVPRISQTTRLKASGLISAHIAGTWPHVEVGNRSDFFTAEGGGNSLRIRRYRNGIDHDSAQLVRGRTTENSHWAIMQSSDGYWSIAPGPVFTNQQNPISMIVKHTAPPENPTEMGVILESRGSVNGVKQSVGVYNFSNSTWTSLESNVVLPFGGGADRYAILPVPNPVNHIGPGREIRLRVEYRNDSPVFVWPWTARIDREMIRYVK